MDGFTRNGTVEWQDAEAGRLINVGAKWDEHPGPEAGFHSNDTRVTSV